MTAEELKKALEELCRELPAERWSNREWTRRIKEMLVRLGENKKYKTCATGICGATWPEEWLYDVVWLDATENFCVRDIRLAAEIEWGNQGDIEDDFQKLLQTRADDRVMIFEQENGLECRLKQMVKEFKKNQSGDRYLFASYADRNFTVSEYVFRDND